MSIKSYLSPYTLFGRFLLIFLIPIIALQIINSYVFYQRHWEHVTDRMQDALINEVAVICNLIKSREDLSKAKASLKPLAMDISIKDQVTLTKSQNHKQGKTKYSKMSWHESTKLMLRKGDVDSNLLELQEKLFQKIPYKFTIYYNKEASNIIMDIALYNDILSLQFSSKRIQSPTANIFIYWMLGATILIYTIAILFMRNQVSSISKLAEFADKIGRGIQSQEFKPCGAKEIKNAGEAIILMRDRIERQIKYRTDMLTHISHDLRTPLTRLKLQTAMLPENKLVTQMNTNISEIEHMIAGYMNFAKEEGNEVAEEIDIIQLINKIIIKYDNQKISFVNNAKHNILALLRRSAIERALCNLLDNGLKYCTSIIKISLHSTESMLQITVEDDGPGIKKEFYDEVFNPFFKIEKNGSGYGLGLTIVKSVVQSHGGNIKLAKSRLGGLKTTIAIPL